MKKAVIFDMDGVIIDSEPVYRKRNYDYLKARQREFKEVDLNRLAGASNRDNWEWISSLWHHTLSIEELQADYRSYYKDKPGIDYREILNPDFKNVAATLKRQGVRIALASSSPLEHILNVLKACDIEEYFELIVSGEQFEQSKPNPEIYLYSLFQLGLTCEEVAAVEDSTLGIEAAKAAHLQCLALKDNRFNYDQSKADICLDRLSEILDNI